MSLACYALTQPCEIDTDLNLGTTTMLKHYSVGLLTLAITPSCSILWNTSRALLRIAITTVFSKHEERSYEGFNRLAFFLAPLVELGSFEDHIGLLYEVWVKLHLDGHTRTMKVTHDIEAHSTTLKD